MNIKKFLGKPQIVTCDILERKAAEMFPNTFLKFRFVFILQLPSKIFSTGYVQCSKPVKFFRLFKFATWFLKI